MRLKNFIKSLVKFFSEGMPDEAQAALNRLKETPLKPQEINLKLQEYYNKVKRPEDIHTKQFGNYTLVFSGCEGHGMQLLENNRMIMAFTPGTKSIFDHINSYEDMKYEIDRFHERKELESKANNYRHLSEQKSRYIKEMLG